MSWKIPLEEFWIENYEFWIRHNPAHIPQRESFRVQNYNIFWDWANICIEKECLSLRYGFGIPSDKSERTFRMNRSDRKGTERILGELAEIYYKETKSVRLVGEIDEYFDTVPQWDWGLINKEGRKAPV